MSQALLETFRLAYRNLELQPLVMPEALAKFRVEYGRGVLEALVQLVEDSPNNDGKIIFTGHRGCGKSTLLAEFANQCRSQFFVASFSISDTIEMSDINHINILFAIALNLMSEAERLKVNIPTEAKTALHMWFAKRTQTDIENLGAEVNVGFDLFKIIAGKLKADATIRNEIKQEFERKVSDLVERVNEIAAILKAESKKEILVIIDDLDKLDLSVVNSIFRDNIKVLCQPNFRVIYTIPVAALRDKFLKPILDTETNDQTISMHVTKLFPKSKTHHPGSIPLESAVTTLCEVIKKRVPEELLDEGIVEKIAVYSGGVLRELIRIMNACCRICMRLIRCDPNLVELKINDEILEEALNDLRNDFALPLGKIDYDILQTTYKNLAPDDPKAPDFLELLHGLHVLEYRNRQIWYDVHPIVVELLRDRDLI
ncbi:P-loop NTPase fold protein [Anthocerotibacter panamensis]|uniref:P-loop NTPase fold protein n=1 Tax=Anthocerotibacter panamensis TaxID=2857077 RepID=UPI001C404833|nr:P-loop NTPase fold protein [Anthocerotibacter panamensis]